MVDAVIYDMDGVLVDSEPYWRIAMVDRFNEAGIPFTEEDCMKTTGMRLDHVIKHWYKIRPSKTTTAKQLEINVVDHLCDLLKKNAKPMPGVMKSLEFFRKQSIKIGLATSSSVKIINTIIDKLEIDFYFDAVQSAERLKYGKPHPEVFLKCAEKLEVDHTHCVVIEDSVNGMISAKAAQMKVIVVPEPHNFNNIKYSVADFKLNSLKEINAQLFTKLKKHSY